MNDFYVGQKVVCVDVDSPDEAGRRHWGTIEEAPVTGEIYTVIDVFIDDEDVLVLMLKEIERSEMTKRLWSTTRVGYGAFRFKPLDEQHKGMEVLNSILLNPHKQLEDA